MREIESLLKELGNADWWARSNAMSGLLNYSEKFYLPFLERALKNHENAALRNAAMEFYVVLGDRALPSLTGLLRDSDPEARLFAANLLGEIADSKAAHELIAALKDTDVNVKIAAAEALGKIADPCAVDALREAVGDEPWVTMSAIKSLGDIGGDDVLPVLYSCLGKEDYLGITFDAIEKAGNENSIQYLKPFVERDDMKEMALKAIVNIADRQGLKLPREFCSSLVPLLIELQGSPHPDMKKTALIALARAEDARGLPYLIDSLNDEDLQEHAISGIMGIGKEAVPALIDALGDPSRPQRCVLAKMVAIMGEYDALLQFSEDSDPEVRVEVVLALGQMNSAGTRDLLSKMLDDPEDEVRLAARRASQKLKKINRWTS